MNGQDCTVHQTQILSTVVQITGQWKHVQLFSLHSVLMDKIIHVCEDSLFPQ